MRRGSLRKLHKPVVPVAPGEPRNTGARLKAGKSSSGKKRHGASKDLCAEQGTADAFHGGIAPAQLRAPQQNRRGHRPRSGVAWLTWSYWHDWFVQLPQAAAAQWASLSAGSQPGSGWSWLVLVPALATLLLLGSVAVYVATDKP